jgi:hypothetical protein
MGKESKKRLDALELRMEALEALAARVAALETKNGNLHAKLAGLEQSAARQSKEGGVNTMMKSGSTRTLLMLDQSMTEDGHTGESA